MILTSNLDQPRHKLRTPTMILRAIIQMDAQGGEVRKALTDRLPPRGDPIHATITGPFGGEAIHQQLIQRREQDAHGRHRRLRLTIVVCRLNAHPTLPPTGEGADFADGFGVPGEPQDVICLISEVIHVGNLRADRVGFWDFFCRLTFGDLLGIVPEGVECGRQRLHRGARGLRVTVLGDEWASDFCGTQTRREPCRAKLRLRLPLASDDGLHIAQHGGQVGFHRLTTTGSKSIQTRETTVQLLGTLTDGPPTPAERTFCVPLAAWAPFFHGTGHKEPTGAAIEGSSCVHEECLQGISKLHISISSQGLSGAYHISWDNLILESPLNHSDSDDESP